MIDTDSPVTVVNRAFKGLTNTFPPTALVTPSATGRFLVSVVGIAPSGFGPTFFLSYTDPDLGAVTVQLPQIFMNSGTAPFAVSPVFISAAGGSAITLSSGSFNSTVVYNVYAAVEQF